MRRHINYFCNCSVGLVSAQIMVKEKARAWNESRNRTRGTFFCLVLVISLIPFAVAQEDLHSYVTRSRTSGGSNNETNSTRTSGDWSLDKRLVQDADQSEASSSNQPSQWEDFAHVWGIRVEDASKS